MRGEEKKRKREREIEIMEKGKIDKEYLQLY